MTRRPVRKPKVSRSAGTRVADRAGRIELLLLDVDGVMTDGCIILDDRGSEQKAFHVRDGHGIKMAQRSGISVGIITGRSSEVVNIRARELGITEVHQGVKEKVLVYDEIIARLGIRDESVAFIGDDIVDAEILKRVGLAAAVADAHPSVLSCVHLVTKAAGGRGAVREVIDLILKHRKSATAT